MRQRFAWTHQKQMQLATEDGPALGPGRENTTVLGAINAGGGKAPPLVIFRGKNIWNSWVADENKSFEGMAYAASPNGWVSSDIFYNNFEKTLIPALANERPVLVVYDGHSTHVQIKLIQLAVQNNKITTTFHASPSATR
jgi:hypothetical protein